MSNVKEKLCLDRIPHFTTLQKFVSRIPSSLFNLVLSRTLKLSYSHGENASITAIDATEFTSSYARYYYYYRRTGKLRQCFHTELYNMKWVPQNNWLYSDGEWTVMGLIIFILTAFRLFRQGDFPDADERTKKLAAYGITYSWLLTLVLISVFYLANYFKLVEFTAESVLSILLIFMISTLTVSD